MNTELATVERLYRNHRFAQVISRLEPQVPLYRDQPEFYRLIGMACLQQGDSSGAHAYLERARELDPGNVEVLLGLAAAALRRGDNTTAIRTWLEVIDLESRNRFARRGLEVVKHGPGRADIADMIERGQFRRLVPQPRRPLNWMLVSGLAAVVLMGTGILAVGPDIVRAIRNNFVERPLPAPIPFETPDPVAEDVVYTLTDRELREALDELRTAFEEFRDNDARRQINLIRNSNAVYETRLRATQLLSYLEPQDFTSIRGSASPEAVLEDPLLHDGTWILWAGRVDNFAGIDAEPGFTFDLLIDYHLGPVVTAVVRVNSEQDFRVTEGDAVELVAQVIRDQEAEAGFSLGLGSVRILRQ